MLELNTNKEALKVVTITEFISIFKNVLINQLDMDLDELNVTVIAKYSNNRLHMTLDTDILKRNNFLQYIQFVQLMKKIFDPFIFTVNTALDVNILINKLFLDFEYYRVNSDMSIELYY